MNSHSACWKRPRTWWWITRALLLLLALAPDFSSADHLPHHPQLRRSLRGAGKPMNRLRARRQLFDEYRDPEPVRDAHRPRRSWSRSMSRPCPRRLQPVGLNAPRPDRTVEERGNSRDSDRARPGEGFFKTENSAAGRANAFVPGIPGAPLWFPAAEERARSLHHRETGFRPGAF